MIRILTCIVLAIAGWLALPAPAHAAQSYDSCAGFIDSLPATISTQGVWCLRKDLSTAMTSGNAITINTNNVTIDCNHFKIGGLAGGTGTNTLGIRADSRFNATVRNCNIRGFLAGVYFTYGGGHLVEDNSFDGNTWSGIYVTSTGSTLRNNLVIDTGGSTALAGAAYGIYVWGGVDVLDNTVNGVAPAGTGAVASGISVQLSGDSSISGNRVRGLAATGGGASRGIYATYSTSSPGVMISDNHVQGPGTGAGNSVGILCTDNAGTARANVVARFTTGISGCALSLNYVNTN